MKIAVQLKRLSAVVRALSCILSASAILVALPRSAAAVSSVTITSIRNECGLNRIAFSTAGQRYSDETFELIRSSSVDSTSHSIKKLLSPSGQIIDTHIVPATGETHTYEIRAYRPGSLGVVSNRVSVVVAPHLCGMPPVLKVRTLHVACPAGGNRLPIDVQSLVFDRSSGTHSVANYIDEVSNGMTSFEGEEEGVTHYLSNNAQCGSSFDASDPPGAPAHRRGRWLGTPSQSTKAEIDELIQELNDDERGTPDRWIVIIDRAKAGFSGFGQHVYVGGGDLYDEPDAHKGQRTILHELGHSYGAQHAGTVDCSGAPFPKNRYLHLTGCKASNYGDPFDPMGVAGYHYSAFNKYVFGWIPPTDVVKIPISPTSTFSTDVTLRDAAWENGPRLIQLVYYTPLPEYFFLEYRRPIGFNETGMLDPGPHAVGASVYIRHFVQAPLMCSGSAPCVPEGIGTSTWAPHNAVGGSKGVIRVGQPYWDPHRKIRVTMLSRSGRDTTLRIEHEAVAQ